MTARTYHTSVPRNVVHAIASEDPVLSSRLLALESPVPPGKLAGITSSMVDTLLQEDEEEERRSELGATDFNADDLEETLDDILDSSDIQPRPTRKELLPTSGDLDDLDNELKTLLLSTQKMTIQSPSGLLAGDPSKWTPDDVGLRLRVLNAEADRQSMEDELDSERKHTLELRGQIERLTSQFAGGRIDMHANGKIAVFSAGDAGVPSRDVMRELKDLRARNDQLSVENDMLKVLVMKYQDFIEAGRLENNRQVTVFTPLMGPLTPTSSSVVSSSGSSHNLHQNHPPIPEASPARVHTKLINAVMGKLPNRTSSTPTHGGKPDRNSVPMQDFNQPASQFASPQPSSRTKVEVSSSGLGTPGPTSPSKHPEARRLALAVVHSETHSQEDDE